MRKSHLNPLPRHPEIFNRAFIFFLFGTIGAFPPIVWIPRINIQGILSLRHSRNLQSGIHVFASSLVFKYCGPLIEAFRGDEQGMIEPFRNDGLEESLSAEGQEKNMWFPVKAASPLLIFAHPYSPPMGNERIRMRVASNTTMLPCFRGFSTFGKLARRRANCA